MAPDKVVDVISIERNRTVTAQAVMIHESRNLVRNRCQSDGLGSQASEPEALSYHDSPSH
jgi:hypothetical protein